MIARDDILQQFLQESKNIINSAGGSESVISMRVAILWTGGKDSYLAYHKASDEGEDIVCLVTFTGDKPFLCHPLELIALQADALGIDHRSYRIEGDYLQGYRNAIRDLVSNHGVQGIFTGDIATVDSFHGDWIGDVCKGIDVKIMRPWWGVNRIEHLNNLVSSGVEAVFTCVMRRWFDRGWLGRTIDGACIGELNEYSKSFGIDPCGEGGEYHTMVLNSPKFRRRLGINWREAGMTDSLIYMKMESFPSSPKDILDNHPQNFTCLH